MTLNPNPPQNNAYQQLLAHTRQESTRSYNGRGILIQRCLTCQLKNSHCICHLKSPVAQANVDFVLIYHRDELFKPTNTGKLIADIFPNNTYAFLWQRVDPPADLINLLTDPNRLCLVVFPADTASGRAIVTQPVINTNKRLTLILLDATWRQSRRMFNASKWLTNIAALKLNPKDKAIYSTRSAHQDDYLSTVESTVLALTTCKQQTLATPLLQHFIHFDQQYVAMKQNKASCLPAKQ